MSLSAPTEADIDAITELCQDDEVSRWTTIPTPYLRSDAEWFVREVARRGLAQDTVGTWGIRTPGEQTLHGMVAVDLGGDGELGFTMDGTVRRLVEQRGQWHDGWIATLLADERR